MAHLESLEPAGARQGQNLSPPDVVEVGMRGMRHPCSSHGRAIAVQCRRYVVLSRLSCAAWLACSLTPRSPEHAGHLLSFRKRTWSARTQSSPM